jgi:DNA-binding transcriptional MocR family regulator
MPKVLMAMKAVKAYIVPVTMWAPELEGRDGPLYRVIADAIAEDLASGRLQPGVRLPTHRDLADKLGVTVGTVSRAYAEAARRGVLSGEVGRGTFVRPLEPQAADEDAGLVELGVNFPAPPLGDPLQLSLQESLSRLSSRVNLGVLMAYPPAGGYTAHREAGALWMRRGGLAADARRVLVCSGSQHAVAIVLSTLLRPGDVLATEELTYPGLKSIASLLHLRLLGLPLDDAGLRADAFEAACRTGSVRALCCVPTLQNPTASLMPEERRAEIARIARAHGVAIVEDDVHALLPAERPLPIAAHAPELSYYITSTSKTLAPGLRVGYLLAPEDKLDRLTNAVRATVWSSAPLMAEIASLWIRDRRADQILEARRQEAAARQQLARALLAGADFRAHPFAYHLWLRLPEPWRGEAFAAEARRRGVSVTPAEAFVVGRASAPHAVRLGLGAPRSQGELREGLRILAEMLAGPIGEASAVL